jgi:hypothetical protein
MARSRPRPSPKRSNGWLSCRPHPPRANNEPWEVFDYLALLQGLGYLPPWDDIIAQGPIKVEPATAALKAGDIAGVWRGAASGVPGDPATSFWRFNADGTYQVAFTLDQIKENSFVETGSFEIEATS